MRRLVILQFTLAALTLAVFWRVTGCDFVIFDDPDYVTQNRVVQAGVTATGVEWAFTTGHASNWHPLTWISHMLNCQLFSLNPAAHHLVNLFIHVANSMLLLEVLRRMTSALWRSAFVAALFAWHPMHVESVAWISELKDVLSALFWLLTMLAYLRYVRRPTRAGYCLTLATFAGGLLCKPMLVTLPFALLLLDYWPLKRNLQEGRKGIAFGRLVLEKIPFIVLSAISCTVTFVVQMKGGAVSDFDQLPFGARIVNALVSYTRYLGKLAWPADLCVLYPIPAHWPASTVVLAALLLLAVSAAALWFRKSAPFLAVGWFWFLGTLVPVIGFIQVGGQAMADRYSYLPSIGLFIAASWALAQLAVRWNVPKPAFALAAAAALIPCLAASYRQVDLWRDSVTLFNHAVTVTDNNLLARVYLGDALLAKGDGPGALANFSAVSAVNPSVGNVQGRIAKVLAAQGRVDDAINGYRRALKLNPDLVEALNNLAWILATTETDRLRDGAEAVRLAERACQLTHYRTPIMLGTLAAAYAEAGRFPEAIEAGEKARQLALAGFDPALAETNQQLLQLYRAGRPYREPAVK